MFWARFTASFATFAELQNDEKTRTFLVVEVGAGHHEFKALADALVPSLRTLRQKEYYSEPRFHASIGWALMSSPPTPETVLPSYKDTSTDVEPSETPTEPGAEEHSPEVQSRMTSTHLSSNPSLTTFLTIPHFPEPLIPTLIEQFRATLVETSAARFEVEAICVKIGKEVSRWRLAG